MTSTWDKEQIYFTGDAYFAELIKEIKAAKDTVLFETYIFEKSSVGDRVAEVLVEAARRGVRVRVLIDGIGSPTFGADYYKILRENGVQVRFFRVLPWIIGRYNGDSRHWYWRLSQRLRTFNQGNHRKICLLDESVLFVGSFNVSDVHIQSVHGTKAWKDVGARVEGAETRFVRRAFFRAYRHFQVPRWGIGSPKLVLLNDSFLHKRSTRLNKLDRMRSAARRILLQTPYFVPPGYILRILVRKAKAGVDVKVIVPLRSDVWFVQWMSLGILHHLSKKGVKIYFYQPRFNHQKVMIVDNWICLGSTNLNHRSFLHDLEMDVVVTHTENKSALEASFQKDLSESLAYDPSLWNRIPRLVRWTGSLLLLMRYWA